MTLTEIPLDRQTQQRPSVGDKAIIIINDFYENPDAVRAHALSLPYKSDSVYPGQRSAREPLAPAVMDRLSRYVGRNITKAMAVFQYQTEADRDHSFIHGDASEWAAVLYLNKDRDGEPGTSFYSHVGRKTDTVPLGVDLLFGAIEHKTTPDKYLEDFCKDRFDDSKWTNLLTVPIRYNRLVLYSATLFHRNASTFGTTLQDARLVQALFFLNTNSLQARKNFAGIRQVPVVEAPAAEQPAT